MNVCVKRALLSTLPAVTSFITPKNPESWRWQTSRLLVRTWSKTPFFDDPKQNGFLSTRLILLGLILNQRVKVSSQLLSHMLDTAKNTFLLELPLPPQRPHSRLHPAWSPLPYKIRKPSAMLVNEANNESRRKGPISAPELQSNLCLLYTSDAADES